MKIEVGDYRGNMVVSLTGEIDMHSSPVLREKLLVLIKDRPQKLIVNFRDVSYIDSSGIATFVEGLKHMKTYNGRLQFSEIPRDILEIFSFSKLDKVFEIYASLDDAVDR
ncbi:MAG: STAS domain-containing protein [Nitrospirae bacterium]|nr:STAS domain-containing protein [Nitrospirota bacterium]